MRMWIVFEKGKRLRHIGHLDLMRAMQRALRRSGLPIAYSQGFNPHVLVNFASPMPVGVWGTHEIMDAAMAREVSPDEVKEALNKALPPAIKVKEAFQVTDAHPAPMALLRAAGYEAVMEGEKAALLSQAIPALLKREEIPAMRKTKSGEKPCDIRPMIFALSAREEGGRWIFSMTLAFKEAATLKPELLFTALCREAGLESAPRMVLNRTRLMGMDENGALTPLERM